jgi:hypothetical protein
MKKSLFSVRDLRFFTGRKADTRRPVRQHGAFGKGGRRPCGAWRNSRGDTSTRDALSRILRSGEKPLKEALAALKRRPIFEGAVPAPILPSNWGACPSQFVGSMSWFGWHSVPAKDMERCARTGGWMKAMAEIVQEHPAWFRRAAEALAKAPLRGVGSPHNKCDSLIAFLTGSSMERWETPGRAYRAISSGIRRAKEILGPFNITTVPWAVVMNELAALRGPKRGNKLGQRLALRTLAHFTGVQLEKFRATEFVRWRGFRHDAWRQMAPEVQEFFRLKMREGQHFNQIILPPMREDDLVKMFVINSVTLRGHEVTEGYIASVYRRRCCLRKQTVVKNLANARTYHLEWLPSEQPKEAVLETWAGYAYSKVTLMTLEVIRPKADAGKKIGGSAKYWQRYAIRLAGEAWATQDREAKANGFELPLNSTVLAYVEDSYCAGNCEAGTAVFMAANGWSNRRFVPVQWLLNKESPRARAAARVALRKFWTSSETKERAS